jgi:broad specificity phosphatase PhoE
MLNLLPRLLKASSGELEDALERLLGAALSRKGVELIRVELDGLSEIIDDIFATSSEEGVGGRAWKNWSRLKFIGSLRRELSTDRASTDERHLARVIRELLRDETAEKVAAFADKFEGRAAQIRSILSSHLPEADDVLLWRATLSLIRRFVCGVSPFLTTQGVKTASKYVSAATLASLLARQFFKKLRGRGTRNTAKIEEGRLQTEVRDAHVKPVNAGLFGLLLGLGLSREFVVDMYQCVSNDEGCRSFRACRRSIRNCLRDHGKTYTVTIVGREDLEQNSPFLVDLEGDMRHLTISSDSSLDNFDRRVHVFPFLVERGMKQNPFKRGAGWKPNYELLRRIDAKIVVPPTVKDEEMTGSGLRYFVEWILSLPPSGVFEGDIAVEQLVVVTHGNVLRRLLASAGFRDAPVPNAGVVRFQFLHSEQKRLLDIYLVRHCVTDQNVTGVRGDNLDTLCAHPLNLEGPRRLLNLLRRFNPRVLVASSALARAAMTAYYISNGEIPFRRQWSRELYDEYQNHKAAKVREIEEYVSSLEARCSAFSAKGRTRIVQPGSVVTRGSLSLL